MAKLLSVMQNIFTSLYKLTRTKKDGRKIYLYSKKPFQNADQLYLNIPSPIVSETKNQTSHSTGPEKQPSSELRWHPLKEEWIIYAAHRQNRTYAPPSESSPPSGIINPLAQTVHSDQPTELPFSLPEAPYDIAIFENLFASLQLETYKEPPISSTFHYSPKQAGIGACEVVVFNNDPNSSLGKMELDNIELLLLALAERTQNLFENPHIEVVMPFENKGKEVGVTLSHPHGQIYAYSFIPPIFEKIHSSQRSYFNQYKKSLIQNILENEKEQYAISTSETVTAWIPSFARYPYETWIAPHRSVRWLHELTKQEISDFALVLKNLLTGFDLLWNKPFPYLMIFYQAPKKAAPNEFHFHIEIFPPYRSENKLKFLAGTELGAGTFASDTFPELKALEIRKFFEQHSQKKQTIQSDTIFEKSASATGRLNLIGEHTDYNLGWVFPMPIKKQTRVHTEIKKIHSQNTPPSLLLHFNSSLGEKKYTWDKTFHSNNGIPIISPTHESHTFSPDVILGSVLELFRNSLALQKLLQETSLSITITVSSSIPIGSGLSSSSAMVIAFFRSCSKWLDLNTPIQFAQLCQKIENEFVGAHTGIMDPLAISLFKEGEHSAYCIDTLTLTEKAYNLPNSLSIATIFSGVSHRNASNAKPLSATEKFLASSYNARRLQCEIAAKLLGLKSLRELHEKEIPLEVSTQLLKSSIIPRDLGLDLPEEVIRNTLVKRLTHVWNENQRVLQVIECLKYPDHDLTSKLGHIFNESHRSLKSNYEITCYEVDTLVELFQKHPFVAGARMTGGGFGGSILVLFQSGLQTAEKEAIFSELFKQFHHQTSIWPQLLEVI